MAKSVYIAEKPSVAREFAGALKLNTRSYDGYLESDEAIITWCVGHLVTMSYPEVYDEKYKKWRLDTLPFLPEEFRYEIIPSAKKQYDIVARLLNREDVDRIYVCTDSGREGEYIYRLVDAMAKVCGKEKRRVWIDSQTEEEILRGIKEAKPLSEYDNLANSAYLRAKEDYLMGINFSRLLSLKYGNSVANFLGLKFVSISVGRVMTCVLGMIVRREREIRAFVKTPFYRVLADMDVFGTAVSGEWKVTDKSRYYGSPDLYKENGFKSEEKAKELIGYLSEEPLLAVVSEVTKKSEKKNPPLLYNLAELQNECSKKFKISPDETLKIVQELYEKKLVTYPRTDARVLSSAIAKVIEKNIRGLTAYEAVSPYAREVLEKSSFKGIEKTKYVNDKQITDHYAIIPTGAGLGALKSLDNRSAGVYELICRRFISIFYPAAEYKKISLSAKVRTENFNASFKVLSKEGYLKVAGAPEKKGADTGEEEEKMTDSGMLEKLSQLKKGMELEVKELGIKEGETSPPKRYNSGSIILAMENAGSFIEDESLREQIKGAGIGTSATRAEILKKLIDKKSIALNKKTQILTPTLMGEMIYDVVNSSIKSLLNPELTASWEKGLSMVAEGQVTSEEYMVKLKDFITRRVAGVMGLNNSRMLETLYRQSAEYYK